MNTPVIEVPGIGPHMAGCLAEHDISTAEELAAATLAILEKVKGVGPIRATHLSKAAQAVIAAQSVATQVDKTAETKPDILEIDDKMQKKGQKMSKDKKAKKAKKEKKEKKAKKAKKTQKPSKKLSKKNVKKSVKKSKKVTKSKKKDVKKPKKTAKNKKKNQKKKGKKKKK